MSITYTLNVSMSAALRTELNLTPRDSLLSPVLRAADVDTFRVYVVDMEAGVFDFGPLGALRSLLVA